MLTDRHISDGGQAEASHPTATSLTAAAAKLLREQGYAATGMQRLLEESGAPRGSLYYFFPGGKEQIAGEAIRRSGSVVTRTIEGVLESAPDLASAVRPMAEVLAANLERSGFRQGCPVATTTLEVAADSEVIGSACAECFDRWLGFVEDRLLEEGRPPARASELAVLLISSFEGALVVARALRDARPLRSVAQSLERELRRG